MKEIRDMEKERKALPMNFDIMKDLRDTTQLNLLALQAIKFIIDQGIIGPAFTGDIKDLVDGITLLLDFWIERQETEINKAVDEFESMDLVLFHSAESTLQWAKGGLPPSHKDLLIKQAIDDMNLILENPELKHYADKATRLREKCMELEGSL